MRHAKGTPEAFKRWWTKYQRAEKGEPHWHKVARQLPTLYTSAPDFVEQFDKLNHYKPARYDWNPSPVDSATAPAIRALLNTVTVEECHE